ncbi:MAG: hypothetical protein JRN21_10050 [Nitrososphaerota archaeon]|nr:hypothetical protein [Nitrososphaerota archaeon]
MIPIWSMSSLKRQQEEAHVVPDGSVILPCGCIIMKDGSKITCRDHKSNSGRKPIMESTQPA